MNEDRKSKRRERWKRWTEKRRARHAANRAALDERREREETMREYERPRFTCARCGRTFRVKGGGSGGRSFVRIGGRKVCDRCAHERFRTRPDFWAEMNPNAIQ